MSVRKVGNRWQVRLRVGDGRRVEPTLPPGATRADALALENSIRRAQIDAASGRLPSYPIDAALDRWIKEEARRQKSWPVTKYKVEVLREFTAGKTLADLQDVASAIRAADSKPATINRYLAIIRRIGNLSERWGLLERAPKIELLPEHNERHVYLTRGDVELLAGQCSPEVGDIVRFAALTGLRRGELLRLKPDSVRDGVILLDSNTKSGRPRAVPLPPEAARIALRRLPWTADSNAIRREFEAARKAVGLSVQYRDLRHTYASWLAQSGANTTVIRDLMGHSNLAVTSRYAHLSRADLSQAVAGLKVGERVGKKKTAGAAKKRRR